MTTTRLDGRPVAAKTKLLEGEHSIDRAQPTVSGDVKVLRWSVRPEGYAKPIKKRTQVPKRFTDGKLRERARAAAEQILRDEGRESAWNRSSEMANYITDVVRPLIVEDERLAARTKARYLLSLNHLIGGCADVNHRPTKSLRRLDIKSGTRYAALEACLKEVARDHGAESARQARTVLSGYVLRQLKKDELLEVNVIRGERIDLTTGAKHRAGRRTGGVALTALDYRRSLDYLLDLDPSVGAVKPSRGRWTLDDVIAKRRAAIDLTLLQAATGLRMTEARLAWRSLVSDSPQAMSIDVVAAIAKGGIPRTAFVLEPRVAEHLRLRIAQHLDNGAPIVGAPHDPATKWDSRNAARAVAALYVDMHHALGIAAFETERSHIWRATLNTMLLSTVPEVMRAAQFGHTADVNRKNYTDSALSPDMVEASRAIVGGRVRLKDQGNSHR